MLVPDLQHRQFDLGTAVALLADLQDDVTNLGVVTPDLYACFLLLAKTLTVRLPFNDYVIFFWLPKKER